MSDSGAAGGRANEGGSSYRAGFAAYLAAHGLAGTAVTIGDQPTSNPPRSLWLETTGAVDDIRCTFDRTQRWDGQVKRQCAWDDVFRSTVAQWVQAVRSETLGERDRVVLVSSQLSAPLRNLAEALRRLRSEEPSPLLSPEREALERFRRQSQADGWEEVFDQVAAFAVMIEIPVENESDAGFQAAAALLDGTVVARDSGVAAINALARYFQRAATRSAASNMDDWLQVISDARIEFGPTSTRASEGLARRIDRYRALLSDRRDQLVVDHFALGVTPIHVRDLAGNFRVSLPPSRGDDSVQPDTARLIDVARRWPRFTVVGLPGSGKTTALEQLAAHWAHDVGSPIPVLVRLGRLVPALRNGQRLSLEDVIGYGDGVWPEHINELVNRLESGDAALLLDGLDECRDQQYAVARVITRVANDLGSMSGLIVSARPTASQALAGIRLPSTHLEEITGLSDLLNELIERVVVSSGSDDHTDRVEKVERWVRDSRSAHPDIWRVPLFAVILAAYAARQVTDALPATRAAALVAAIEDSVRRWEQLKSFDPAAWDPDLHPDMLIDGFAAIGHAIVASDTSPEVAMARVAATIAEGWGYAERRASAIARDVLHWWLDRVGTFVLRDQVIGTRVELIAEVGDALWASRQEPNGRSEWIAVTSADPGRYRESLLLAVALNGAIGGELLNSSQDEVLSMLVADAVIQGADLDPVVLEDLVERLVELSLNPPSADTSGQSEQFDGGGSSVLDELMSEADQRQLQRDGASWQFRLALARMPLPPEIRELRNQTLLAADGAERQTVAMALASMNDAIHDGRALSNGEVQWTEEVLALPFDDKKPEMYRLSRRHLVVGESETMLSGRAEAVAKAIPHVDIDHEAAERLAALAGNVPAREAQQVLHAIESAGFATAVATFLNIDRAVAHAEEVRTINYHRDKVFILEVAATTDTSREDVHAEATNAWRLTGAATLFEILRPGSYMTGVAAAAVDQVPELVRYLVRKAIQSTNLALASVAQSSSLALRLLRDDPLSTAVLLNHPPYPDRAVAPDTPSLGDGDIGEIQGCLTSGNDWVFWTAMRWAYEADWDDGLSVIWSTLDEMAPRHRLAVAAVVADALGEHDVVLNWRESDDPALRLSAVRHLARSEEYAGRVSQLASDRNLSIRLAVLKGAVSRIDRGGFEEHAALASEDVPEVWTCHWCLSVESMEGRDCRSCSVGDRKDLATSIADLRKDLTRK